MGIKIY